MQPFKLEVEDVNLNQLHRDKDLKISATAMQHTALYSKQS